MTFNPDDPKYTAYVLGELSDSERADIDAELQANPQAAALAAEIHSTTARLLQALHAEPLPALSEAQRDAVLAESHVNSPSVRGAATKPPRRILWVTAISASLLLAVGAGWLLRGVSTDSAVLRSTMIASSRNNLKQSGTVGYIKSYQRRDFSTPPSDGPARALLSV